MIPPRFWPGLAPCANFAGVSANQETPLETLTNKMSHMRTPKLKEERFSAQPSHTKTTNHAKPSLTGKVCQKTEPIDSTVFHGI